MLFTKISNRIGRLREDLERSKEKNDFSKCLYLEGAIFHLEMVLIDINQASQQVNTADS